MSQKVAALSASVQSLTERMHIATTSPTRPARAPYPDALSTHPRAANEPNRDTDAIVSSKQSQVNDAIPSATVVKVCMYVCENRKIHQFHNQVDIDKPNIQSVKRSA